MAVLGGQVMRRELISVAVFLWISLAFTDVVAADTDNPAATAATSRSLELKEEVGELPEGRFERLTDKLFPISRPHIGGGITFKKLSDWERRVSAEQGFDYAFINAPLFQAGSENSENYADNEMNLYLQWRIGEDSQTRSRVFFWGTYVQTFSSLPNGAFSQSQDLITSTISAGTDPNKSFIAPSALWWEQNFFDQGFTYRAGQLFANSLWANNRYTADDRQGFMNSVLSSSVGLPWSDRPRGLGGMVRKSIGIGYLSFGIQDAKAEQDTIDFSSFSDGDFLYTAEVDLSRNLDTGEEGKYKLTLGYMDSTGTGSSAATASGWGLALSARQDFANRMGVFAQFRRSMNDRVAQGIETSANAGVVFNEPFGWPDDELGIGLLYANPADNSLNNELGAEVYYRLQLTHRFDLAPDVQYYRPTGRGGSDSSTVVIGLRLRYIL